MSPISVSTAPTLYSRSAAAIAARASSWRVVARDVDDLRDVEVEAEAVGRTHRDRRQIGIELVRFGLAGRPVEHDVRCRDAHDLVGERIDRILARIERLDPDPLLAAAHEVAVPERVPGDVLALPTDEGDHDADVRDRHLDHLDDLHRGETGVDEIPAAQQDLFLQPLAAAGIDERLRPLKQIVPRDDGSRNFAGRERLALARGHDADLVVRKIDSARELRGEQQRIDAISARPQDRRLRSTLAAAAQKRLGILEGVAVDVACNHAAVRERLAVACLDDTDLRGWDDDRVLQLHAEQQ